MSIKIQRRLQSRVIDRLIELHRINYGLVDFDVLDRKHAIYILQGAAITSAVNASRLGNQVGMLGREWRYIVEISRTIEYLDELDDNSRELRAWFLKDGVIERRPLKNKQIGSEKRRQKSGLGEGHFELIDKLHKQIVDDLSLFAHPTIRSARPNMNKVTNKFDYYQTYKDDPELDAKLKGTFASEALSCFLLPVWSLPLARDHRNELIWYKKALNGYFSA